VNTTAAEFRVLRGGGWNNNAANVRAANRNRNAPDNRNNNIGVRCVVGVSGPRT
jgi:formylglycine-generating enzyme required for sulfatase activity